ncbi:YihY/virulence factor BrkB family protein [Haloferula sargassicola]|uniref:UPF0761 membrane protein YihY n=1 Tax=Haloferula sargassicola TaxID=490096 RepID=A0ABP9UPG6_9BACT
MAISERSTRATGREASQPLQIPLSGWLSIGKRVVGQIGQDHVQIVSAGVAFYFFLSLFPAIAAFLSIYGLITTPAEAAEQMQRLQPLLPGEGFKLISDFAGTLAANESSNLGWGVVVSILLSIWSTNKGTTALFTGLNIAYDEKDSRSFLKKKLMTLGVTVGAILTGTILLSAVAVLPAVRNFLPVPGWVDSWVGVLRWPLFAAVALFGLAFLYKIAPHRTNPEWHWITPGSIVATGLWLLGSVAFAWYIEKFGDMSKTYGSVAAIAVMMLWFYITAFSILLGAEINGEAEHQTARDSTVGPDEPLGQRGAFYADHVAGKSGDAGGFADKG